MAAAYRTRCRGCVHTNSISAHSTPLLTSPVAMHHADGRSQTTNWDDPKELCGVCGVRSRPTPSCVVSYWRMRFLSIRTATAADEKPARSQTSRPVFECSWRARLRWQRRAVPEGEVDQDDHVQNIQEGVTVEITQFPRNRLRSTAEDMVDLRDNVDDINNAI